MKNRAVFRRTIAILVCLVLLVCDLPFLSFLTVHAATPKETERALDIYHGILSMNPQQFCVPEASLIETCGGTAEKFRYMKELASEVTKNCNNDQERIYAVVEYVARNVYYDYDHYEGRTDWTNSAAYEVLTEGFSVCAGYQRAVYALLQVLRIPCISILSYDHSYGMAFNGDRWVFVDATWVSLNRKEYGEFYHSDSINVNWLDFSLDQAISDYNHILRNGALLINDGYVINYPFENDDDIALPSTATEIGWHKAGRLNNVYLPRSVKKIHDNTFSDITISKVFYEGSKEEFESIDIGEGNENLLNAPITYLDCASVPSITRHPLDLVTGVDTEVILTAATAPVDGTVSYQWYRSTSRSNTGGIAIPGATQAAYTFTPTEKGTFYYYVVARNENLSVSGDSVSSDTSIAAQVDVLDRVPDDVIRLGPNVIGYQFSDPNETHLTGSGPLWAVFPFYDIGTAFISPGITDIENCLDWLQWCDGFYVDSSHPDYYSDELGILYQKSTNTLLCMPKYVYRNTSGSYTIPEDIRAIADEAIASSYLNRLHIPAHVTDIQGSLGILSSLRQITVDSDHPCFSIHNTALIDTVGNRLIKFPAYSNYVGYAVPDGIRKVEDQAFYYADITTISLPDTLQVIGDEAFQYCSSVRGTLTLPKGLTRIGDGAFSGCKNISGTLVIPNNVTSLGDRCFESCSNISSVILPDGLEVLPSMSFFACDALTSITIPYGLRRMEESCLSYGGLKEITIPSTVNYIAEYAFSNHESITVYGCSGSYAETYAKAHNMPFVNIGIAATSVKAEKAAAEMIVGMSWEPKITLIPSNATDAITLTSSDPAIVSVIDGYKLLAKKTGQVTIQAVTTSGVSCNFSVIVYEASNLRVTVLPSQVDYECGEVLNLDGIQVDAVLNNGKVLTVTDFVVSDFETQNPGKKEITVSVGSLSDTFSVYVGEAKTGMWTGTCQWHYFPSGALAVTGSIPENTMLYIATYQSNGKLMEIFPISLDKKWVPKTAASYAKLYLLQENFVPGAETIRIPFPSS